MRIRLLILVLACAALCVRLRLFFFIPDPIFEMDSGTYFLPALDRLFNGHFSLSDTRTPGYPLFLFGCFSLFPHFLSVLVAQHLVALATAVLLGVCHYFVFERSVWKSSLLAFVCAVSSGQILFAHTVMSEILYTFFLVAAVFLFFVAEKQGRWWLWAGCATCAFLSLFVRPVGQALAAPLILFLAKDWRRNKIGASVFAAVFVTLMVAWCGTNYFRKGFFGMSRLGGIAVFGTSAHLLDVDRVKDERVRSLLKPVYEKMPSSGRQDPNWVRFDKAGPVGALRNGGFTDEELDRTCKKLTMLAISHHPLVFLKDQASEFVRFVWQRSGAPKYIISKEFSVIGGLTLYEKATEKDPRYARLLNFQEVNSATYFSRLQEHRLYPYEIQDPWFWWLAPVKFIEFMVLVTGFGLGIFCLFRAPKKKEVLFLMLVSAFHIVLTNLGGDSTGRHAIPVEPLCLLLSVYGAGQLFRYLIHSAPT